MKRRNFVRAAALGTFSLGLSAPGLIATPFRLQSSSTTQWLRQLSWALAAKRKTKASFAPEALATISAEKNVEFAERAYKKESDYCYFPGDQESICFYPLVSRHNASGIATLLLPVFRRDKAGDWQFIRALNGFQLEALARAAAALHEHSPKELQNWLIPVETLSMNEKHEKGVIYKTAEGTVAIITKIKTGQAHSTCKVTGLAGVLFQETFTSRHLLNA